MSSKRYALYIIKPQENPAPKGADEIQGRQAALDDIHDYVVMIYQACGLDKKIPKAFAFGIFWRRLPESDRGIKVLQTSALPLG